MLTHSLHILTVVDRTKHYPAVRRRKGVLLVMEMPRGAGVVRRSAVGKGRVNPHALPAVARSLSADRSNYPARLNYGWTHLPSVITPPEHGKDYKELRRSAPFQVGHLPAPQGWSHGSPRVRKNIISVLLYILSTVLTRLAGGGRCTHL